MKRFLLPLAVLLSVVAGGSVLAVDPLPELVAQTLQDVREQEKLSHDVYLYFSGLYVDQRPGQNIFARVTEAEQRHMDAVLQLLQKYGVADPVAVDGVVTAPGEFPDQVVEDLYAAYVEQGEAGLARRSRRPSRSRRRTSRGSRAASPARAPATPTSCRSTPACWPAPRGTSPRS